MKDNTLLSQPDIDALEAMQDGSSGYFYRMLSYLEQFIQKGAAEGRFTREEAQADLEIALWYSYACNNIDDYEHYYQAAQWMPASEGAAGGCGTWYYRYSCALMYCGRLEEARLYAERGVAEEPDYPWGWLQAAKLRSHFGDRAGALEAVDRGLALEPGDYEFTVLRQEILDGRNLEEMENHYIDPEADRQLAAGELDEETVSDKLTALSGILCREDSLNAIKAALSPERWEADNPYCTGTLALEGRQVEFRFFMNEAALSKLNALWVTRLVRKLPELVRRGLAFLSLKAGLSTDGLEPCWFTVHRDCTVHLCYANGEVRQIVCFDRDFSLPEDRQPALRQPGAPGCFLAFVLLERPEWDPEQFKRDLRDLWGIPCMTAEEGEESLVFDVGGAMAAVSLFPFPVPDGEAGEGASRNYLWPEGAEAVRGHRGQLMVSLLGRELDPREGGVLQVKLVSAACRQPGALGVYANGTVLQPELYLEAARELEEGEFPLLNLVWLGLYRTEEGMCGYTEGLTAFGKDEIEVLNTQAQPGELRGFLGDIAYYLITEDVTLRDGETIGFSEDQRLPITRSAGAAVDGMSLKIGFGVRTETDGEEP